MDRYGGGPDVTSNSAKPTALGTIFRIGALTVGAGATLGAQRTSITKVAGSAGPNKTRLRQTLWHQGCVGPVFKAVVLCLIKDGLLFLQQSFMFSERRDKIVLSWRCSCLDRGDLVSSATHNLKRGVEMAVLSKLIQLYILSSCTCTPPNGGQWTSGKFSSFTH